MSPEQAEMTAADIDTRSDIYSLGVLLYELLTSARPFDLREVAFGEIQRIIREDEPPKPSTRLSSLGDESATSAKRRRVDPKTLARELRGELDWIVMKALEKDRNRRYETASGLAMDLRRHLGHEPVLAGPPSGLYRVRKFIRRHRAGVLVASGVLAVLLTGGFVLQRSTTIARKARFDAAVAEAKLRAEEAERLAFKGRLRAMVARLREAHDEGLDHEVLPQIWLMEWMFDPKFYGQGEYQTELWGLRIQVVGALIDEAKGRGGESAFQTLLWESALAFWLLSDGRHSEAESLVADNYAKWAAILDPDDPWLLHLRAMQACVSVGLVVGDLEQAASTLERVQSMLSVDEPGSGMHRLVLTHLQLVYGHDLLNRPQRLFEIDEALRAATE